MRMRELTGAVAAGLLDAGLEAVWASNPEYWSGRFPYVGTVDPLPPADDWLVLGVSAGVWALGKYVFKNPYVEGIGQGMLYYSVPMIIHHTVVRASGGATVATETASMKEASKPKTVSKGKYVVTQ